MSAKVPEVVLFGYESSPFTWKIRHALRLKQVPYHYVVVPSMMPRPLLRETFGLTYRKIPVLLIGNSLYVDTSIICEALDYFFPSSAGYPSLYPTSAAGKNYRPLIRGFSSYWTDRPLFRVTTGLIPSSVWRTHFGTDRSNLIGHRLDPDKLEKKVPLNKTGLDLQLSLLEPLFQNTRDWVFDTVGPSLADVSLFYQLEWGWKISRGQGIENLTGGGAKDTDNDVIGDVFTAQRYPGLLRWYEKFKEHVDRLPKVERVAQHSEQLLRTIAISSRNGASSLKTLPTPAPQLTRLDESNRLTIGTSVAVAPDDTGASTPTTGTLLALTPEEIVIKPQRLENPAAIDVNVHFPRLGFTVRPTSSAKL